MNESLDEQIPTCIHISISTCIVYVYICIYIGWWLNREIWWKGGKVSGKGESKTSRCVIFDVCENTIDTSNILKLVHFSIVVAPLRVTTLSLPLLNRDAIQLRVYTEHRFFLSLSLGIVLKSGRMNGIN